MKKITKIALSGLALSAVAGMALAGTASTEFDAAVTLMTNWLEGSLGLALSLAFFAVGLFMGLMRQSIMAAAVAVGCAFAVQLGPNILSGIVAGSAAPVEMAAVLDTATPEALPAVLAD